MHSHRQSEDFRIPSNAPPLSAPYTPQQQQQDGLYSANPSFNVQQATPRGSASSALPGALQPAGGVPRAPPSTFTTPPTVPSMNIATNAQQYTQQSPSRSNPIHSHSRSSPTGMDGSQKYIPFNHTPSQNSPSTSNPKAYNLSHTQSPAGPSHSPLNLTDIRSRAISDANDGTSGTNVLFSYSDTPTNSNYLAPFPTYAYDWCKWPVLGGSSAGKMAVGSYLEDPHNFIQILDTHIVPQEGASSDRPQYGLEYTKVAEATCAYPVTRILWEPPSTQKQSTDLLATSGDHLRLWSLPQPSTPHSGSSITRGSNSRDQAPPKLQPLALLSNSKTPEHTAPLTSLDWNTLSPKLIITSSIDTTCTIWDIPTLTAKTQLIAHDKEVFDVRFCAGSVDVFVSCGADGSVRMFDLRSLEHSTIIYEPAEKTETAPSPSSSSPTKLTPAQTLTPAPPLLRLAASPHDSHVLATFASDSNVIRILDVRQPGQAFCELRGHQGNLNTIEWHPSQRGTLASGADDSLVLIWNVNSATGAGGGAGVPVPPPPQTAPAAGTNGAAPAVVPDVPTRLPLASWRCEYEVANVSWSPQSALSNQVGDWLGVCAGRGVWGVRGVR
ncbi:WD40-repeat-containing domain protein [Neohortaea acidophila]|uniref:WD40-repeat-containing domain protein n=1 Tax=Neohortaea acidophila TaxID=245834 RepID=A0A6A6Q389_9PEZI|nr:WD40-repeat-containing domain protein [Neohortaea acidophila]KAF2486511.1 WD40-repeat-containing domain protein [Neohortaea acidophila]